MRLLHIVCLLTILTSTLPLFSYDILELDGHIWKELSIPEAVRLTQGMLMSQYVLAKMLIAVKVIDQEDEMVWLENLAVTEITDMQIMYEITAFYYETERWEYPIGVVFFIRNEWKTRPIPKFNQYTWIRRR